MFCIIIIIILLLFSIKWIIITNLIHYQNSFCYLLIKIITKILHKYHIYVFLFKNKNIIILTNNLHYCFEICYRYEYY